MSFFYFIIVCFEFIVHFLLLLVTSRYCCGSFTLQIIYCTMFDNDGGDCCDYCFDDDDDYDDDNHNYSFKFYLQTFFFCFCENIVCFIISCQMFNLSCGTGKCQEYTIYNCSEEISLWKKKITDRINFSTGHSYHGKSYSTIWHL